MLLKYEVDIWSKGFGCFYNKFVPKNTLMREFTKNLLVDRSVNLEDVANAAVYSAFNPDLDGQKLYNVDIEKNSMYYSLNV
mmetsp:Transcript_8372/g.1119  ORF Transcript_8372/g.1119 Transcript_8372/m.1119 type:complete len:81 (-) Transcript_8372:242-484(-)